ncbi:unnamed protein product, partial [Pocillopora meandrina]
MIPGSATHKWDLFINGMKVEVKSTLKILGLTLDRKISNNETKEQSDRLEDANYYILTTLFRTKNESHETLLSIVGMNTLKHRRYYQALVLTYKCLNSIGPKYIADFLNLRDICYKLSGKGSNLIQPHFNTEWMHKSSSLIACKLWNKLPL